ncbi:MAG TPA: MBL fold metallo-hydrolase [Caulobacteraceae bacterium]|jgi:glyoxylase-like metal-dependent hydrolase (beta-lactamase superfamily II)|nr:MBL fold metallo-hydrolase [Caulobacteraceae bacterium]
MNAEILAFFDTGTNSISYLVADPETRTAAIVDPVLDFDPRGGVVDTRSVDRLLDEAASRRLSIAWILETHPHADHLTGAHAVRERTGAPVVIGAHVCEVQATWRDRFEAHDVVPDGRAFDRLVADEDFLAFGGLGIRVLHTPGHTPACVSYLIGEAMFVGDALFMPDYGSARCDFPGGDAASLYRSIRRLLSLPDATRIFVGHDYLPEHGRGEIRWETSVAEQRTSNIHVRDGVTEQEFCVMRRARDATLAPPAFILPALQVNIRAGAMPPPTAEGHVFLKIPVTGPRRKD